MSIVRANGYEPYVQGDKSAWGNYTLRVLVGVMEPSDGYNNYAFFFVGNRYLGTDAAKPSADMKAVGQNDGTVTLQYTVYQPNDALATPSGGHATVRFHGTGQKLVPLDPIPTDDWSAPLSRR